MLPNIIIYMHENSHVAIISPIFEMLDERAYTFLHLTIVLEFRRSFLDRRRPVTSSNVILDEIYNIPLIFGHVSALVLLPVTTPLNSFPNFPGLVPVRHTQLLPVPILCFYPIHVRSCGPSPVIMPAKHGREDHAKEQALVVAAVMACTRPKQSVQFDHGLRARMDDILWCWVSEFAGGGRSAHVAIRQMKIISGHYRSRF